jgi:hypothetical protein
LITFITQSGSVYEIEPLTKLARCVVGKGDTRLGHTQWKRYSDYVQLPNGCLLIELEDADLLPGSPDCARPCVMTSRIVEVRS